MSKCPLPMAQGTVRHVLLLVRQTVHHTPESQEQAPTMGLRHVIVSRSQPPPPHVSHPCVEQPPIISNPSGIFNSTPTLKRSPHISNHWSCQQQQQATAPKEPRKFVEAFSSHPSRSKPQLEATPGQKLRHPAVETGLLIVRGER